MSDKPNPTRVLTATTLKKKNVPDLDIRMVVDPVEIDKLASVAKSEFEKIFYTHHGRKINKWHHYLSLYQRYFQPIRNKKERSGGRVRFLEIGVWQGGSLEIWKNFFGENSTIFGIDIDESCLDRVPSGCNVRIGSQSDPKFLAKTIEEMGGVDIILDDASHFSVDQIASFRCLFPKLAPGGVYACEDMSGSYRPRYDGGHLKEGTFVEFLKKLMDDMHGWVSDEIKITAPECNLERMCTGIHLHDGISFIEKRNKGELFKVIVDRKHPSKANDSVRE